MVSFKILSFCNYTLVPAVFPVFVAFLEGPASTGTSWRTLVTEFWMSVTDSKCVPFNTCFIWGNKKKSQGYISGKYGGCSSTEIFLELKNCVTLKARWHGALS